MSNYCEYEQFIKELDYCKNDMCVWGAQYDLMETVYCIRRQVKNFYPANGIPKHIMDCLNILEENMKCCKNQLEITCDVIINNLQDLKKGQK